VLFAIRRLKREIHQHEVAEQQLMICLDWKKHGNSGKKRCSRRHNSRFNG